MIGMGGFYFGGGFGGFYGGGGKSHRGEAAAATRDATKFAADSWAAADHPFCLADLVCDDAEKRHAAFAWYGKLSLSDTKSECKRHGLPVSGSKKKLFEALRSKAMTDLVGDKRGAPGSLGSAKTSGAPEAAKVRRALVADLRKCLVFDKKLKKDGACKMLKATYAGCTPACFAALFPHANGKAQCALDVAHLEVDRLAKDLRYGSRVRCVEGSLKAKIDGAGTIAVSGKYALGF